MISIFSVNLWVFHEIHVFYVNLRPGGDPRARTRLKPIVYWWFREVRLRAEWCISHQRLKSVPKTFCVRGYIFLPKFRIPQKSWNFAIQAQNINFGQGITRGFSIRRTLAFPSRIFTPTHDPHGFYGNFANFHVRVPFSVIPMLFSRADGGKSKTPRAQP